MTPREGARPSAAGTRSRVAHGAGVPARRRTAVPARCAGSGPAPKRGRPPAPRDRGLRGASGPSSGPAVLRRATRNAICAPWMRRAANARVSSLARSSHWRSSIATRTGPSRTIARRTSATARPIRPGSGGSGEASISPNAASRARRRRSASGWEPPGIRAVEQPGQARERDLALGDARPPGEEAIAVRGRVVERRRPQRALADARLAIDEHEGRPLAAQCGPDRLALRLATDDRRSCHEPGVLVDGGGPRLLVRRTDRAPPGDVQSLSDAGNPVRPAATPSFPWFHGCGPRRRLPLMARHTHTPEATT